MFTLAIISLWMKFLVIKLPLKALFNLSFLFFWGLPSTSLVSHKSYIPTNL